MTKDRRNTAYRTVQLGGLAIVALGMYVTYLSAGAAWEITRRFDWPFVLLELLLPLSGVGLSAYFVYLGYRLMRGPSVAMVVQMGVIGWLVLSDLLYRAFLLADQWIKPEYRESYTSDTFLVAVCIAALVAAVGFRRLAKRSGLLEEDASWWHEGNIRALCGILTFVMFVLAHSVIEWVNERVVWGDAGESVPEFRGYAFFIWLVLMAMVYKAGPPLLMWLLPPRDQLPTFHDRASARPPAILRSCDDARSYETR